MESKLPMCRILRAVKTIDDRLTRAALLVWALSGAALAGGCQQPEARAVITPAVSVAVPTKIEAIDEEFFEGYLAAIPTVEVRARVTGYLTRVFFKDGHDVKEGDPLFLIDPRPYEAILQEARAQVGRAEARVKRLDLDLARAEKLLPERNISKEDYDKVVGDRSEAIAEVRARQAAVEQADLNFRFTGIKSPISGRVSRTMVDEGNLVSANITALTTIVAMDPIYAYFDVDERTVQRIRRRIAAGEVDSAREKEVKIYLGLDSDEGYPYEGVIDFIDNTLNQGTGTLKVRARFDNKKETLSPGYHVRLRMPEGRPYTALAVPERAIGTMQGQKFVFVVNGKDDVEYRGVTLGRAQGDLRIIAKGLEGNERVIVDGLQRVRAGVKVAPKPLAADPQPQESASKNAGTEGAAGNGEIKKPGAESASESGSK